MPPKGWHSVSNQVYKNKQWQKNVFPALEESAQKRLPKEPDQPDNEKGQILNERRTDARYQEPKILINDNSFWTQDLKSSPT